MAKQYYHLLVLMAFILHAISSSSAATSSANSTVHDITTVYDVLHQNNLPRGLLPQGVQSYVLHVGGALEVTLPGECTFSVMADGKQYKFYYGRSVGGNLINGSITRLYGVRMELALTWFRVNQIVCVGNHVKVELEMSTQWFPISAFAQSPHCN